MKRLLYDVALFFYLLISVPSLLAKKKFKKGYSERLGRIPESVLKNLKSGKVIWVHAVSVGEVRLACNMMQLMRMQMPDKVFLLTVNTESSREIAGKILTDDCYNIMYFPLDFSWIMKGFIKNVQPVGCVIIETEIWPNMIDRLKESGCPIVLVNGRISDKAFKSYRKITPFIRPYVKKIDRILVQNETYKKRFLSMGASLESVAVTGNMKYDLQVPDYDSSIEKIRKSLNPAAVHVMIASSHLPEEKMIADELRDQMISGKVVLWIAPRHLNRIESVISSITRDSERLLRFSEWRAGHDYASIQIIVVDEWGILNKCYPFVDCVVMGGTFTDVGGHNIGEPAVCGKMIFHGPQMRNFEDMKNLFLQQNASIEVRDVQVLKNQLVNFTENREPYYLMAGRAKAVMRSSMGATKRNVEVIKDVFTKN